VTQTFSNATNPQSETKKIRETKFDALKTGRVKFFPFVIHNLKELNLAINEKHDLTKNKEGYLLHSRQISYDDLVINTGEKFADSICSDKNKKVQEYFAFVPGWSDYLPPLSVEEVQLFHILRKFLNDEEFRFGVSYPTASSIEKKILKMVQNEFSSVGSLSLENKVRLFMRSIENRILANYKFYSSRSEAVSSISLCEVKWHGDPADGYGKFIKYQGRSNLSELFSVSGLELIIKAAKSSSNFPPKSANEQSVKERLGSLGTPSDALYPNPKNAKQILANMKYAEEQSLIDSGEVE
tara:strand:+ start:1164 stop:2054 length:891 start_codon:yes stop_codon:yes gene_type:complete